ncbi:response regulator transcription factor [Spirosoma sp. SC4-14]|uniref:response regulator transcription factor n=1 Tax=Spirosoma sp. SC4-14 TaxID=3128900 RepID=UPI0030CA8726
MKILLIIDELKQSDWLRRRLELENNQVATSPDWQTGWLMAHESQFDIVVVAIQLSESNQNHLLQLWQAESYRVPLFLLISPDTPANKAWGLESGADDCVGYSVDSRELMARLYALHRRKFGTFPTLSSLRVDDLEINLIHKTVYRAGKRIDLLPREYYLLAFLMQNRSRVVSKKEILENVWSKIDKIRPNTVEVYINYLRKKIDSQATIKLIHTVVGMGYVIRIAE